MKKITLAVALLFPFFPSRVQADPAFTLGAYVSYTQQNEQTLDLYGRNLSDVSVYAYGFDANDNLIPASPWVTAEIQNLTSHPVAGRKIYATIVNEVEGPGGSVYSVDLLTRILRDPTERARHIQQLVAISQTVDGIDIDYEALNYESGFVDITDDLTAFFKDLRAALPPGKKLTTDLLVKVDWGQPPHGSGAYAYDWVAIEPYVDELRLMIYEYYGSWSAPGPQSSPGDVAQELNFAIQSQHIPASKIKAVFDVFSWDWDTTTGGAVPIEYGAAMTFLHNGGTATRDQTSQCLIIKYTDPNGHSHVIWMDDSVTYQAKIQAAIASGVSTIDFFYMGSGDPAGWEWMATQVANGQPLLFQLTPAVLSAGRAGQPLSLRGANFSSDTSALWNGIPRTTTVISKSTITFNVPSTDLAVPGIASLSAQTALGTSNTLSLPITPSDFVPIRINSGGQNYTDNLGQLWSADMDYDSGFTTANNNPISNTATPTLYRSERWSTGSFNYTFTVPIGTYTVTLKFAEIEFTARGQRVFNVLVNGQPFLTNFDPIVVAGGPNLAVDETWSGYVTNPTLKITFVPVVQDPIINAIQVLAQKPPQPTITTLAPASVTTGSPSFNLTVSGNNFVNGSVVEWNTVARPTTLVAPGTLSAVISAQDVATPQTVQISVVNPDPTTDPSVAVPLHIDGGLIAPFTLTPPRNVIVYAGQRASFHFDVGGSEPLSYAWETQSPGQTQFVPVTGDRSSDLFILSTATIDMNGLQVRCTVTNSVGSLQSSTAILTVLPNTGGFEPIRIHAGGGDYTDDQAQLWYSDNDYAGGSVYTSSNSIPNTTTPTLYRTGRQGAGDFLYRFAVPNGKYAVTLKFAETFPMAVGGRVFEVDANGQSALPAMDIVAETGAMNTAIDKTFMTTVADGQLAIHFGPVSGAPPIVSALQVTPADFIPNTFPVPVLTDLSVYQAPEGSPDLTFEVFGSSFVPTSVVTWNGALLQTIYISSTTLQAVIPAVDLLSVGTNSVRVLTSQPGGGTSFSLTFTVFQADAPAPVLLDMSQYQEPSGIPDTTFNVFGSSFVLTSSITWNDIGLVTSYVSAGDLRATIPASLLISTGSAQIRVFTPAPDGGTSHSLTMTIYLADRPQPMLTDMSSYQQVAGSPDTSFNVLGSSFTTFSAVTWNGMALSTFYMSDGNLRATIPASFLVTPGSAQIRVVTPAPGGGTSHSLTFTILQPDALPPTLLSLSATTAAFGGSSFVLTVNGNTFEPASVVQWDGSPRATTYESDHVLSATITPNDLLLSGNHVITVFTPTPGGGTSAPLAFTVNVVPLFLQALPATVQAGGPGFDLDITGAFFTPDTVVLWAGQERTTRFISSTELSALITTADIATPGQYSLALFNPAPGGLSGVQTFVVTSAAALPGGSGNATSDSLGSVRVYPNPWRADRASSNAAAGITFDHLVDGTSVKIFTADGRWVKTVTASGNEAIWDLRNTSGESAASGYYLYLLKDPAGHHTRGTLMLIR